MFSSGRCGGWGDRQRGLVGMFVLALVTGRRFGINMTVPCNVTNFFMPNEYNWIIQEHEIANKSYILLDDMGSRSKVSNTVTTRIAEVT